MPDEGRLSEVVEFLSQLWPDGVPDGTAAPCVALRPSGPAGVEFAATVEAAAEWLAARDADGCDVYVQAAAMNRGRAGLLAAASRRGGAADVAVIAGFYVDLDVGPEKFPTVEAAVAFADSGALPVRPTLLVGSGGGVHAWLLFAEPHEVSGEDDLREMEARVHGFSLAARQAAATLPGSPRLDAVWDLARIGRVPGTTNRKLPDEPRPVTLIRSGGPRLQPSDLDPFAVEPSRATVGQGAVIEKLGGFRVDPTADVGLGKFQALRENVEAFGKSWEHQRRDLHDQSNSAYDLALATLAAMAGWSPQEVCDLVVAHRRKWQHASPAHERDPLKLRNPGYYASTIARAFEAAERFREGEATAARDERREQELREIADAPSGGGLDDEFTLERAKRAVRDFFRQAVRVEIDRVERYGDESAWRFRVHVAGDNGGGMIAFRSGKALHSWAEWYHALLARGVNIPQKPPRGWGEALAAMHACLVVDNEDSGSESGLIGYLSDLWRGAGDTQRAETGEDGGERTSVVKRRGASLENWGWFRDGDAVLVHLDKFLDRNRDVSAVRPFRERADLAAALKSAGARRTTVAVPRSTMSVFRLTVEDDRGRDPYMENSGAGDQPTG